MLLPTMWDECKLKKEPSNLFPALHEELGDAAQCRTQCSASDRAHHSRVLVSHPYSSFIVDGSVRLVGPKRQGTALSIDPATAI